MLWYVPFYARGGEIYLLMEGQICVRIDRQYIRKQLEEDKMGEHLSLPYPGSPFTGRK